MKVSFYLFLFFSLHELHKCDPGDLGVVHDFFTKSISTDVRQKVESGACAVEEHVCKDVG